MDSELLIKKIRAGREVWLELQPAVAATTDQPAKAALKVKVRRPAEAEIPAFLRMSFADGARAVVVDWAGFTEATLLGDTVGASDAVPFSREVWAEVVGDRGDWVEAVSNRAIELIKAHKTREVDDAKN